MVVEYESLNLDNIGHVKIADLAWIYISRCIWHYYNTFSALNLPNLRKFRKHE